MINTPITPTHDSEGAQAARFALPKLSMYCLRCGWPMYEFGEVTWHAHEIAKHVDIGALCEGCWKGLGHPEARIEYYHMMFDYWVEYENQFIQEFGADFLRAEITRVVANGK